MPVFAAIPILTTAGEIALPVLAREFAKRGGTAFIKTYGKAAFQAVTGGTAGAVTYDQTINKSSIPQSSMPDATRIEQMDASMAVPNLYKDTGINKSVAETGLGLDIGDKGEKEKERARIAEENKELMKGSTPPVIKSWEESYPDLSGKIADSSPPPSTPEPIELPQESYPDQSKEFSKPIIYNKDDVKKQTDKLVPEKVELGPLSAADKQTAIALKGDKPDYYSRIVQAIKDTKQDKMPKEQWASIINKSGTKTEIEYLGLADFSKSKESITKEELLKSIKDKDITSNLVLVSVPKEDQLDFSNFSIGGAGNTTRQYVLQLNKDPKSLGEIEFNRPERLFQDSTAHFIEKYGVNSMGHTRAQIGFDPSNDEDFANLSSREQVLKITDPVINNATEKLKNTFIVDEYQSPWIQQIQKKGTAKDWVILKGSDITEEFVNKNYKGTHELREVTGSNHLEAAKGSVIYTYDKTLDKMVPYRRLNPDLYHVFSKEKLESTLAFPDKEQAQDLVNSAAPTDLPIKTTKEYFKILYAGMIKEAIAAGADSIGITNGQIQADRYEGQDPDKAEGLKKAYDEIFYPLIIKQAKQDGVKDLIEKINIRESEPSEQEEISSIPNRMKMSMQNGFVLKKVRGDILYATLNDAKINIPDFFTIYSSSGRAQGHDRIMGVLNADHEASEPERINNVLSNPNQYFIWVKAGSALSETLSNRPNEMATLRDYVDNSTVDFSMPITIANPGNNLTTPEDNASEGTTNMTNYSSYILDYKNKGIDLSYEHDEHQIIKMPLPKELLKKALTKPIKLSKVKTQANRLTA